MKRVTIYDVAREAEVSLATVSRVMNGSDVVKEATKNKVEEAIKKLGYKPNAIAQGLALQRTTTIGLIFPEESLNATGQLVNGLCDVAKIYDYNINLHAITQGITNIQEVVDEVIKSSLFIAQYIRRLNTRRPPGRVERREERKPEGSHYDIPYICPV